MPGVGDLVTNFVVNSDPAVQGFNKVGTAAKTFDQTIAATEARSNKGGAAIREFSRGFEDFAISASTGGIAAGMRGATNNINAFLATAGPWGGFASVLVTLTTVTVGYFEKTSKAAKEATKSNQDYLATLKELEARAGAKSELNQFLGGNPSLQDLQGRLKGRRGELASVDAQLKTAQSQFLKNSAALSATPEGFAAARLSKQDMADILAGKRQSGPTAQERYEQQQERRKQLAEAIKADEGEITRLMGERVKIAEDVAAIQKRTAIEQQKQQVEDARKMAAEAERMQQEQKQREQREFEKQAEQQARAQQKAAEMAMKGLAQNSTVGFSSPTGDSPFAQTIEKGSAEAFRTMIEANFRGGKADEEKAVQKDMLKALNRSNDILRRIAEQAPETVSIGGA